MTREELIKATEEDLLKVSHADLIKAVKFWREECETSLKNLEEVLLKGQEFHLYLQSKKINFYDKKGDMLLPKGYLKVKL